LALRARIVLACADGGDNKDVAAQLGVWPQTVGKWRARFVRYRLDGLCDAPRPGAPRKITDEQVEAVIVKTLEETPASGGPRWSTRSLARATGMSQTAISRIWRTFGLKPHGAQSWTLSADPQRIGEARGIVGLYIDPPRGAMVLAKEKSQVDAPDSPAPVGSTPVAPTHGYLRLGPSSPFAALDVAAGEAISQRSARDRQQEFLHFLKIVDANTAAGLDLHLICDTGAPHKTRAVRNWLAARPRFHVHVAPTYVSWLTLVERWFTALANRTPPRDAQRGVTELQADVTAWITTWNENGRPFVWTAGG
jgi:transposase